MRFLDAKDKEYGPRIFSATDWDNNRIVIVADARARAGLASFKGADVAGLTVDVLPAVFTPDEYDAAIRRVAAEKFPNSDRVESFGVPVDASLIEVRIKDFDQLSVPDRSTLREDLERITGEPIRLESSPELVTTRRGNFVSPWAGGGQARHNHTTDIYYGACSTGFSVLEGVYGRVLGARHCDQSGSGTNWAWVNFAQTATFTTGGSAVQLGASNLDTMLTDPVNGTEGTVFGGAYDQDPDTARFKLSVNGAKRARIGDYVCTSGAVSGEHFSSGCLIRVDHTSDVACSATASGVCHRFWGYNVVQYGISNADGDSGGPVYADLGNDRVGARGIIWGADSNSVVACANVRPLEPVPTTCYHWVLFSDIMDDLEYWGVQIETN
jgi:hypothetical protein